MNDDDFSDDGLDDLDDIERVREYVIRKYGRGAPHERAPTFVDPHPLTFAQWQSSLARGYRFDLFELSRLGNFHGTVEIVEVTRDIGFQRQSIHVTLDLRVIDDTYSLRPEPRNGDIFAIAYPLGRTSLYDQEVFAEGYFARLAAWRLTLG